MSFASSFVPFVAILFVNCRDYIGDYLLDTGYAAWYYLSVVIQNNMFNRVLGRVRRVLRVLSPLVSLLSQAQSRSQVIHPMSFPLVSLRPVLYLLA